MQGTGHTLFERRLRRDIDAKNALSEVYEGKIRFARRFRKAAGDAHGGRRRLKKYTMTAERLLKEAEGLRVEVLKRVQDLEQRIRREVSFSEQEVAAFQSQFETEHREWLAAQERRQAAAKALRMLTSDSEFARRSTTPEGAASLDRSQREVARSASVERRERRDVERVKREVDSEARDKIFYTRELQRIVAERITLSS